MINIIKSVLFDCGYEDVVQTEIEFEKLEYKIDIFKNEDVGSQVFIVLQTLESQLVSLSGIKDFIIEIANFFRESDIYLPDMDKNTSLVFCVKNDINSEKLDALKVKIEDDPFYFKKYVFSYSEAEADELKKLCKQHRQTPNELVQTYILDTNNFSRFKKNASNEKVYRLVSELLIKIPVIPIKFKTQGQIKSVPDFLQEIQKCNDDEVGKLDRIIQTLCDSERNLEQPELIDIILEDWGFVSLEDENE